MTPPQFYVSGWSDEKMFLAEEISQQVRNYREVQLTAWV